MTKLTWRKECYNHYLFAFLLVCCFIWSVSSKVIYVNREEGKDKFGVNDFPVVCKAYHEGAWLQAGKCICPTQKSTFIMNTEDKCVDNDHIWRKLATGCSSMLRLKDQSIKGPYRVLDLRQSFDIPFDGNQVTIMEGTSNCQVNSTVYFIDDYTGDVDRIVIDVFSIYMSDARNKRKIKLNWTKLADNSNLHGRVIRLMPINCTFKQTKWATAIKNPACIIIKAKGTITFPVSSLTTTLSTPSSRKSSSPTGSIYSSSLPIPGTLTPTSTLHRSSVTSSAITPTKPSGQGPYNDKSNGESSPTGAIVGAIFAVLGAIVIIVLVVLWRRRDHKKNKENEKDINKLGNPTYGRGEAVNLSNPQNNKENSDFEYDYAAVDGDPRASNGQPPPGIYQSLTPDGNRESVYTPLDRQQDNPLEESTRYDKIDHQVFQPGRKGPTDPQYNVLQRPNKNKPNHEYLEPGVHINRNKISSPRQAPQSNEPVYNVLEDPSPGGIVDEPEYNVLEDPNGQHDPENNVLEDLEGQYEPEYNVLEAPDSDHDKGPAKGHPSSHDNVGYASTIALKPRGGSPVYAAPEGPISEPTYQPLTINAPDDSVYQPLDRRSRIVPDDQPVYHVLESATSTDA